MAFSVVDLAATERWFREGLGFWPAGGSRRMMRGPLASSVQGLPRVASTCWWMVDRNEFFQLEMFQFERPLARLMPHDSRPCDIGYARIGVWVADFDQTLTRLARLGSPPLSDPIGPAGARRACVRNPDGVYVEIMEDDPLSGAGHAPSRSACPVAVRSVTLSVPDLARSEAFFARGLGLERSDVALRAPEHEALWGLAGAQTRSSVFTAGSVLVELVQYLDPVGRPRPAGYRISDQGILNIAFGARSRRDHRKLYHRARAAGARENRRPVHLPGAGVVYVNDPDQFSVELLWMSPASDKRWGFTPRPAGKRPRADTHAIERTVRIAAPAQTTWDVIAEHETMPEWVGLGSVRRTVDGAPDPDGRGSERLLKLPGASITEQVLAYEPPSLIPLPRDRGIAVHLPPGRDPAASRRRSDRAHLDDPLPAEAARNRPPARERALLAARARAALGPEAARRSARPAGGRAPVPAPAHPGAVPGAGTFRWGDPMAGVEATRAPRRQHRRQ